MSRIYESILNSNTEVPEETTSIAWEHNPVNNKLRSSVFMKKGSYREPSEVSSIDYGKSMDSECSLEDSHILVHGYDVPPGGQALLT